MRRLHPHRLSTLDIDRELLPVDRIFQRWARSVGCGIAAAEWDGTGSRPTELPPDAAIAVDRYVCTRPERMRKFLHAWYRGQDASASIAKRFNCGRDEVYVLWRATLMMAQQDLSALDCLSLRALLSTQQLVAA